MLEVTRKLVDLLDLSPIGDDHFQGDSEDLGFPNVFGGQVLGQALMAASRTVEGRHTRCTPTSCAPAITACPSTTRSSGFGTVAVSPSDG